MSRERFRFIWTKFQPKRAHLGPNRAPFHFSISQNSFWSPNSSKSNLGPGAIGPRTPSNMGSRAHGGRRPTFRRGVGGRSPPTATRGSVEGWQPPPTLKWCRIFSIHCMRVSLARSCHRPHGQPVSSLKATLDADALLSQWSSEAKRGQRATFLVALPPDP